MKREYCDYIWDVVTGDTDRHAHYTNIMKTWPEEIQHVIINKKPVDGEPKHEIVAIKTWPDTLSIPKQWDEPKRILVAYHGDLLNQLVRDKFIKKVIKAMEDCPQHTFLLITRNTRRYSKFKWPSNCMLGARLSDQTDSARGSSYLLVNDKNDLWLLFDNITETVEVRWDRINWVVFDASDTGRKPRRSHVYRTMDSAIRYYIPIYVTEAVGYGEEYKEEPNRRV